MRVIFALLIGVSVLLCSFSQGMGASNEAMKLRKTDSLVEFSPAQAFLDGNFVADELDPAFIFGKVKDFAKSRPCPTAWLIEEREKVRLDSLDKQSDPVEYTLYLEEDCPGKVVYYVFVDRSQANTAQWLEWREKFHFSKAEPEFGAARANLDQAFKDGFQVDAELRFVKAGDKLELKKPEESLAGELKFKPIYDLRQGKALPH